MWLKLTGSARKLASAYSNLTHQLFPRPVEFLAGLLDTQRKLKKASQARGPEDVPALPHKVSQVLKAVTHVYKRGSLMNAMVVTWPHEGPRMAHVGPKMAQEGPKRAPRWPTLVPRWPTVARGGPKMV